MALFVKLRGPAGSRELLAILDTGATYSVIPTNVALRIGYEIARAARVRVITANGLVEAPKVCLAEASVGELRATDVEALCYDMPGAQVSALLGLTFLRHFRLTLDLKGGLMDIEDP
ncbi:MAG: TIGR02281 family clan AA aspartic protease [Candidatus Brocadiia bacterium]